MLVIKDTTISEVVDFLDTADQNGKLVPTVFNPLEELDEKHTVSYEARELKRMYMKMRWSYKDCYSHYFYKINLFWAIKRVFFCFIIRV